MPVDLSNILIIYYYNILFVLLAGTRKLMNVNEMKIIRWTSQDSKPSIAFKFFRVRVFKLKISSSRLQIPVSGALGRFRLGLKHA